MKEMYTGKKNEEAATRAEKERFNLDVDAGGGREVGSESKSSWTQQERIDRADSQRSSIFSSPGTAAVGGMLDHLIGDCAGQVAVKEQEIQRLSEDISRLCEDIKRLNFRIQELKTLRDELQEQFKQQA